MLVSITWREYSIIILIASALYYILIIVLYYKGKILTTVFKKAGEKQRNKLSNRSTEVNEYKESSDKFFQNQIKDNNHGENRLIDEPELAATLHQVFQPGLFTSYQKHTPSIEQTDDTLHQVQNLTAQLKEAIGTAVEKNVTKEEFILSLQTILKNYDFLKGSSYLVLINNLIASECEKYGYLQLSAEERVMLWNE